MRITEVMPVPAGCIITEVMPPATARLYETRSPDDGKYARAVANARNMLVRLLKNPETMKWVDELGVLADGVKYGEDLIRLEAGAAKVGLDLIGDETEFIGEACLPLAPLTALIIERHDPTQYSESQATNFANRLR